jgi:hypothetical protein
MTTSAHIKTTRTTPREVVQIAVCNRKLETREPQPYCDTRRFPEIKQSRTLRCRLRVLIIRRTLYHLLSIQLYYPHDTCIPPPLPATNDSPWRSSPAHGSAKTIKHLVPHIYPPFPNPSSLSLLVGLQPVSVELGKHLIFGFIVCGQDLGGSIRRRRRRKSSLDAMIEMRLK